MPDLTYKIPGESIIKKFKDMFDGTFAEVMAALLQPGENHFGEVGGNCNIISAEIIRPADTTQYATNDVIGINVAIVGITAHTNGNCKVEVAAAVLDTILLDQDFVTIAGVVGTTEANGNNIITKVDPTHFTIPVSFQHAWSSAGTIAKMAQMDIARVNGGSGYLNWLRLVTNNTTVTNATFDIYMYWNPITGILDNAQHTVLYANAGNGLYLGSITLAAGGTGSDSVRGDIPNLNLLFKCAAGSKRLYFRIVNTTATGYIPASAQKLSLTVGADLN